MYVNLLSRKKDHLKNIIEESLVWGNFEISSLIGFLGFILAHFEHLIMTINYIFSLNHMKNFFDLKSIWENFMYYGEK